MDMDLMMARIGAWSIFGALVIAGAIDLYLALRDVRGGSVSSVILQITQEMPIAVLMAGILIGHLFWPQAKISH